MSLNDTRFNHYKQLLAKVDEKFAQIHAKYPTAFSCGKGCFSCCKSGLSVTRVEAEHIRSWLALHQEAVTQLQEQLSSTIRNNGYCQFLDRSGSCSIYEARPVVCRSHGAPTLVPIETTSHDSEELSGDVCPLNFKSLELDNLSASDWIRLDTLNLMLAAIDRDFDAEHAGERVPLEPREFINVSRT